jgi:hypothetical protein
MYSFETRTENGKAVAVVSRNDAVIIYQDYNHKNSKPFASEAEAAIWATDYCAEMEEGDLRAAEARKTAELVNQSQIVTAVSQASALLASDPVKYASLASFVDSAVAELSKTQQ